MLKQGPKQLSLYSILYDKIPKDHILKVIDNTVDFSFINPLLADSYCKNLGRPAKEPEMMAKLLILQYMYNLSDIKVIEEASLNLAFMWFIGVNPEEDLPDASLLAKFRTQRLKGKSVDDIIKEVIRQCVAKGIVKDTGLSVDCTHTRANTIKKVPERIMKHLAKKIIKTLEHEIGDIPQSINTDIPNYKEISDHKQAMQAMQDYLNGLMAEVEKEIDLKVAPKTQQTIIVAKEILKDPKFILQKGLRSLVDQDARIGYKSKTDSFFGYKVEYAMLPDVRLITAVEVHDGAYVDGTEYKDLYTRTKECGIEPNMAYGDKAYFRKSILDILKADQVEAIIPVSESVYRIAEERFSYNKDSDQWFCEFGNHTIKKQNLQNSKGKKTLVYTFEKHMCKACPKRNECGDKKAHIKRLVLGINTPEFYQYNQYTKTAEFKEKYKKRASHEWKNGELKRFHGLNRARGFGLKSMGMQAKLTALAVNLKRIAKIVILFPHYVRLYVIQPLELTSI